MNTVIKRMTHMKSVADKKYKKAYKLYKTGLSLSEVGGIIGVTRQCVYDAFKVRGFVLRTKNKRLVQYFDDKKFTLRNTGYYSLTVGNRMQMHRYVWEYYFGEIPDGYDIHHINENRSDNRIENLECLSKSEHTRRYSPHNNQFTKGRKRDTYRAI